MRSVQNSSDMSDSAYQAGATVRTCLAMSQPGANRRQRHVADSRILDRKIIDTMYAKGIETSDSAHMSIKGGTH